jgi:NAD-dependent deacetylase
MSVTGDLARARAIVAGARALLVLTGAGVSAESGIPTFRGAGGYWRTHRVTELATPEAFARDPRLVWDWYLERRRTVSGCVPNAAHRALAAWSTTGRGRVVTQNVDGLHERAGTVGVVRLHGSLWTTRCPECGCERPDESLELPELPRCPRCGALERPGVVWFGEALPDEAVAAAMEAARSADAVLVIGTSGVVHPAAGFVTLARRGRARVVDVNPAGSEIQSDVVLPLPAGEAVPALLA